MTDQKDFELCQHDIPFRKCAPCLAAEVDTLQGLYDEAKKTESALFGWKDRPPGSPEAVARLLIAKAEAAKELDQKAGWALRFLTGIQCPNMDERQRLFDALEVALHDFRLTKVKPDMARFLDGTNFGRARCSLGEGKLEVDIQTSLFPTLLIEFKRLSTAMLKVRFTYAMDAFKDANDLFTPEMRAQLGTVLIEALHQTVRDSEKEKP